MLVARPALPVRCATGYVGEGGGKGVDVWKASEQDHGGVLTSRKYCCTVSCLRETFLTVGVSEKDIGRIQAMCFSIRPRRDPALMIRVRSGLLSRLSPQTQQTGAASVRWTFLSSERKVPHELSGPTDFHEPCATSFIFHLPTRQVLPEDRQVLMDHKAATAQAGHCRNSTYAGRRTCEERLFTRVVSGAGLPPSIGVMPLGVNVLRRRRIFPSSRPP